LVQVIAGDLGARLRARLPERHQLLEREVAHAATSSPSQRRRSAWARASCDLEKLGVLPIITAISSWVYPSTSCSHTTAREVSESRSSAASRSIRRWVSSRRLATTSSCSSSVSRYLLRLSRMSALLAAMVRIHPQRLPSSRYCPMLRQISRNVSWSTSSASSAVRQIRRQRLYTGTSKAR